VNQTSGAPSVNTFNLQGTGSLTTGIISAPNSGSFATNTFNFTGGTLTANSVRIALANNGGTLSPAALRFGTTNAAGADPAPATAAGVVTSPVGVTTFTGTNSYTQGATGRLAIELSGPGLNDRVDIGGDAGAVGTANLAGTIAVSTLGGFDPDLGSTFDVLTADSIVNAALVSGTTPGGRTYAASIVPGTDGRDVLRLTVVPEPASLGTLGVAALGLLARRPRRR
jgi:hypothetical protein